MKKMPIGMQKRKLREYIVKAGYDPETFDINAYVDSSLSYRENRANIAGLLKIKKKSTGGRKAQQRQADHQYCEHLQEKCEISCDNNACKTYNREGCRDILGRVEPCGKDKVCPIPVRGYCVPAHTRACNSRSTNPNRKCPIPVKAYCVPDHFRKCQ